MLTGLPGASPGLPKSNSARLQVSSCATGPESAATEDFLSTSPSRNDCFAVIYSEAKFDRRDRGLPYIMRGPTRSLVLLLILSVSPQVLAADKELIQLHEGAHTLQDQIAKAQTSLNETMGLMADLLKRNAEQIPDLQHKLDAMKAQLHPDAFPDDQARKMTSDIGEFTVRLKDFTIRAEKIGAVASAKAAAAPAVSQSAPEVSPSAPQPREKMAAIPSPAPANMPVVPEAAPQPAEKSGTLKPQEPSSAQPSAGSPRSEPWAGSGDGRWIIRKCNGALYFQRL